jgi:hypothetical protein
MTQPFSPQIVAVPFFASHTDPAFDTLKGSSPAVGMVVLEPGLWQNPAVNIAVWRQRIQDYQSSGIKVLGYVPTDGGTGTQGLSGAPIFASNGTPIYPGQPGYTGKQWSTAQINQWVDRWYTLFAPARPDGIFFDEGPDPWRFNGKAVAGQSLDPSIYAFYVALHNHVHQTYDVLGQPAQIVMLNAAYYIESVDWILGVGPGQTEPAAEIALLWEGDYTHYSVEGPASSHNYPNAATRPAWWTSHPRERYAHTTYGCLTDTDMCQAVSLGRSRGAGYIYVYDGNSSAYDHLPAYWNKEMATVALRNADDVYVRDWTDSGTSFDQGTEPSSSAHPFWVTSDVWNRLTNTPGTFNSNDQPENENPQMDSQGNNTNYAFARIHRAPCNQQVTVTVDFLYADFGAGGNFQYVGASHSTSVVFNPGDYEKTTPGVQWSIPASASPHVCLAVEVYTAQDPLKNGSLNTKSSSVAGTLITEDNNKAQINLEVIQLPAPPPPPQPAHKDEDSSLSHYAIVHNGEKKDRVIALVYQAEGAARQKLKNVAVQIIDNRGKRLRKTAEGSGRVSVGRLKPGDDRWVGFTFELDPDVKMQEGETLQTSFHEVIEGNVVNGFTIAPRVSKVEDVISANLNLHAAAFRRIEATHTLHKGLVRERAERQSKQALALFNEHRKAGRSEHYAEFLRNQEGEVDSIITELLSMSHQLGDPFELKAALTSFHEALRTRADVRNLNAILVAHTRLLYKLDPFLTMLQRNTSRPHNQF